MLAAFLLLTLASAQRTFDIDCENPSDECGQQTAAAAKCLTPCFKEAQACFKQVGTVIARIQQCMLDLGEGERQPACNQCINEQLESHCDEYFAQYEAQCGGSGGGDEGETEPGKPSKFYFKTHGAFAKFCNRLGSKDECLEMGCNWAKRGGCDGRLSKDGEPKLKCKRIRNRSMCNSVLGCSLRKKSGGKRNNPNKVKVCKGTAEFPEGL